jgi:hypothetical protein
MSEELEQKTPVVEEVKTEEPKPVSVDDGIIKVDLRSLNKEEENTNPYVYNVYQNIAQEYDTPQNLQYTYGTASNPVFEWVKRIQSGTRTYNPQDDFDNSMLEEYKKLRSF